MQKADGLKLTKNIINVLVKKINISSTQFELKLSNYNLSKRANNKVIVLRVFLLLAEESWAH